jgi:hypothetical protein
MDPQALRERVATRIRMRKEAVREEAFLNELLRDRPSSSPPATFRAVAEAVVSVMKRYYTPPSSSLTVSMAEEVMRSLKGREADTLIVAGTRVWRVDEAVARLATRGFSVSGDSVRGVAARLYAVFREWAEHELLAQEALARGLERTPEVRRQIAPWRDHYLAGATEKRIHEQVGVTDAEVYEFMRVSDTSTAMPEVRLRILQTAEAGEMQEAFRFMEQGGSFEEAVRRYSVGADAGRRYTVFRHHRQAAHRYDCSAPRFGTVLWTHQGLFRVHLLPGAPEA